MRFRLCYGILRLYFATLLVCFVSVPAAGQQRVSVDPEQREIAEQRRELHHMYIAIGLLAALMAFGAAKCFRTRQLNRRLRESEALIKTRNEALELAGEELRRAKERAEQASRMKTEFIQSMTHEVRTPLNSIIGFSKILTSQFSSDPSMREYASIIENSSLNLLRLVEDVLDLSSLDQTEVLPRLDRQELNSCCHECTDVMLRHVKPGVAMVFESSAVNPPVLTNVRRVLQVVNHLLHNAAKFTTHGEIILNYACLPEEGVLRFTVSDTGPGIPREKQEEVFGRFVKLDSFSQGTGLGLAVCRIIATKLGGRLYFDSDYARGCRVIFEVPLPTVVPAA